MVFYGSITAFLQLFCNLGFGAFYAPIQASGNPYKKPLVATRLQNFSQLIDYKRV